MQDAACSMRVGLEMASGGFGSDNVHGTYGEWITSRFGEVGQQYRTLSFPRALNHLSAPSAFHQN